MENNIKELQHQEGREHDFKGLATQAKRHLIGGQDARERRGKRVESFQKKQLRVILCVSNCLNGEDTAQPRQETKMEGVLHLMMTLEKM